MAGVAWRTNAGKIKLYSYKVSITLIVFYGTTCRFRGYVML